MPITGTTNDVSMNPAHGEVYFIQHYVIKFVSELQQASTLGTLVSSTYKMDYTVPRIVESGIRHHNPNHLHPNLFLLYVTWYDISV